jgi:hypothetical protein
VADSVGLPLGEEKAESASERARTEFERLREVLPAAQLCNMLARRYPVEIVQRLFPGRVIPQVERATEAGAQRTAGERVSASSHAGPRSISNLLGTLNRTSEVALPVAATPAPETQTLQDDLGFLYVPLIQCTFPHSDPGGLTAYTRRNGHLELTISTSLPTVGLPYGVPARLLAIYTATEVLRNKSRELYLGKTVTEFLRRLGVPASSGSRGTVGAYIDQVWRLVNTVFTIQEHIVNNAGRQGLSIKKKVFADEAFLWKDADGLRGSSILLSTPLYESMLDRSAPLSMDAVRALRRSPLDLDLYAWLVYRLYTLHRRLVIPWKELCEQFGQDYARERDFHASFRSSMKRVLQQYPEARVEALPEGLCLLPSRSHITSKAVR